LTEHKPVEAVENKNIFSTASTEPATTKKSLLLNLPSAGEKVKLAEFRGV
jgi:hypothetical protein